jgi:hypothetical protein
VDAVVVGVVVQDGGAVVHGGGGDLDVDDSGGPALPAAKRALRISMMI